MATRSGTTPPSRTPGPRTAGPGLTYLARAAFLALHWAHAALFMWPRALRKARGGRAAPILHPASCPPAPRRQVGDIEEFGDRAGVYDVLACPFTIPLFRLALRRIAPLPDRASVLDLGCGPGRELGSFAAHPAVQEVVGVDVSPTMCAHATHRAGAKGLAVRIVNADAAGLPAELHDQFDLVLASLTHHHFPDPGAVAREAVAALKPGGRYCIIDYGPDRTNARLAPLARVADPGWCGFMTPSELAGLLFGAGFSDVRWSQLAPGVGVAIASAGSPPAQP